MSCLKRSLAINDFVLIFAPFFYLCILGLRFVIQPQENANPAQVDSQSESAHG